MVAQRANSPQEALQNCMGLIGLMGPMSPIQEIELFMKVMKTLSDNEESAEAKYEIERATIDSAELSLFIGGVQAATLARGNFEFGVEWGKLIFAWWDEGVSQSWRVTAYEIDRGELRLKATRGMACETALLTLLDSALRREGRRETRGHENMTLGE